MRTYNVQTLIDHLKENVMHDNYHGHNIHSVEHSIEFLQNVAKIPSNKGGVPAFVVRDEFGGAIERIISSKIVSHLDI